MTTAYPTRRLLEEHGWGGRHVSPSHLSICLQVTGENSDSASHFVSSSHETHGTSIIGSMFTRCLLMKTRYVHRPLLSSRSLRTSFLPSSLIEIREPSRLAAGGS